MEKQSRVLVVSYNALSKENANGRTMEFLVHAFSKENLAQLFFSNENPDFSVCDKYYRVTEKQLLEAFLKRKKVGGAVFPAKIPKNAKVVKAPAGKLDRINSIAKKNKGSNMVKFLRNSLWSLTRKQWFNSALDEWICNFSPDVILTVSGKSSCFHNIVLNMAKKYSLPVVVYHCEDYCFKNMYPRSFMYGRYIKGLKKSVDKLMKYASLAIYNSDAIKELYSAEYSTPSMVAYMSTDMQPVNKEQKNENLVLSYMGNLSLGRDRSLYQIGKALSKIDPSAKINIYAPGISEIFTEKLKEMPNMEYKGFVNYEECREIIAQSDILLHGESFNETIKQDLRIAFSTKIADSLASGVAFFVYAPKGIASTDYLLKHNAACVATSKEELEEKLSELVNDAALRAQYAEAALKTVKENHTLETTVKRIEERINRIGCNG